MEVESSNVGNTPLHIVISLMENNDGQPTNSFLDWFQRTLRTNVQPKNIHEAPEIKRVRYAIGSAL